jgi:hypothetical protein
MLVSSWGAFENGHLDVSFERTDTWPMRIGPIPSRGIGAYNSNIFFFGDPVSGPSINLATWGVSHDEQEHQNKKPESPHRSDSFRMTLRGNLVVSDRHFGPGDFAFLEAGHPYSNGLGASSVEHWQFVMMGDRRGASIIRIGGEIDDLFADMKRAQLSPEMPTTESLSAQYPDQVPHDSNGTVGVMSTIGPGKSGRLIGSFADADLWQQLEGARVVVGILGDHVTGPVVALIKSPPGMVFLPGCSYETEVVIIPVKGSCEIGSSSYSLGDVRIHEADRPLEGIRAGSDGLEVALIWGDRRFAPAEGETDVLGAHVAHSVATMVQDLRLSTA